MQTSSANVERRYSIDDEYYENMESLPYMDTGKNKLEQKEIDERALRYSERQELEI